ncbi:MAG: MoxR family ATPase [Planctomycetota bacterium]|nr:MoxR family ATPase [Planctomycetota bacterium]
MSDAGQTQTLDGAAEAGKLVGALRQNIQSVFVGKPEVVRLLLTGLLAGGHVLLEDVPGVGKTVLAKAIARSMHGDFRRVQFTPDLLPSDILGVAIYDQASGRFEFKPGPVFTHVLVADEINRATPRTQSALLEAMNDFQVTVDRTTHPLPAPFFVVATQNPYEFEGTYPLPESQLDRFLLRVRVGYPTLDNEREIVRAQKTAHPLESLEPVLTSAQVRALQQAARAVKLEDSVLDYALQVTRATRESKHLSLGVSPRGSLALTRAAQAHALIQGRDYVLPDDVKSLAVAVLAHRVMSNVPGGEGTADEREKIIRDVVETLEVPV